MPRNRQKFLNTYLDNVSMDDVSFSRELPDLRIELRSPTL